MARTVAEWVGKTDDSQPTDKCKLRVLARQDERCAVSGKRFREGDKIEFDHIVPLWLGGRNCESNLQAILAEHHKRKTQAEATVRAKIDRNRAKRLLGKKKASGWNTRYRKKMNGEIVDRQTGDAIKRRTS